MSPLCRYDLSVSSSFYSTTHFQKHTAQTVALSAIQHPDYSTLAARLLVTEIHKTTSKRFSTWVSNMAERTHSPMIVLPHLSLQPTEKPPVFTWRFVDAVQRHSDRLDSALVHTRDFDMT